MDNVKNIIDDIAELKDRISAEDITPEKALELISNIKNDISGVTKTTPQEKSGALKSLMITFNISNYSDMTVFFKVKGSIPSIIEETGDNILCSKIEELLTDDPGFYRGLDRIEISGTYYKLFHESMTADDTVYTVISVTQSSNFRSTRFHILCDLLMDYTNSLKDNRKGLFNDLFDYTVIEFTKFISLFDENGPNVYFFKYEYISEFFNRIGLATIIEISRHIRHKLIEIFGNDVSIIRLSLSSYVVVASKESSTADLDRIITRSGINFNYKGILLPYTVIQVPYKKENSIYDIFENVYLLKNYLQSGDVRI